jgi:rhamnosyltransferase
MLFLIDRRHNEFPSKHLVCAVMVTYNPDLGEMRHNLAVLLRQADAVVVDNSTVPAIAAAIRTMKMPGLAVVSNGGNLGVATAQNQGLAQVFAKGYKFALLMDQDSVAPDGMVEALVDIAARLKEENAQVACVGPVAISPRGNPVNRLPTAGEACVRVDQTLSSGMLIPNEAYQRTGGMEDGLFIDLVDYEWCWRAASKGLGTYIAKEVVMPHRLGDKALVESWIRIPDPLRHYYQFRNSLRMFGRPYVPATWKAKYLLVLPAKLVLFPIMVPPRLRRLRYILRGILDFMRGRSGAYQ